MTSAVTTAYRINRQRRTARERLGVEGLIDGPTVAAHIRACLDAGWTRLSISATTGISDRAIRYILNGQPKVQRDNALRLLAVRPEDSPRVSTLGAIRRTKALARAGYPIQWTADQVHCSNRHIYEILNGTVEAIDRGLAERFADLYRRHEVIPGPSNPARIAARSKGWPGPDAWDVDSIDDPDVQPDFGDRELGFRERAELRREEIIHLAWHGDTPEQILARLDNEVSISTVRQIVQEWRTGQKRQRTAVAA